MAASELDEKFVFLKGGLVVLVEAYCLLLELERRGLRLSRDGAVLVVTPASTLTEADCVRIRRWKLHLLMLMDYCARTDVDAHLFS
jgi:hypothetical protein